MISRFKPDRSRWMSRKHLELVRQLPSCVSGRTPCEAHHLQIKEERGVGLKATDRWAVPLTADEHRGVHSVGSKNEVAWFQRAGVDCIALAKALWKASPDFERMDETMRLHLKALESK